VIARLSVFEHAEDESFLTSIYAWAPVSVAAMTHPARLHHFRLPLFATGSKQDSNRLLRLCLTGLMAMRHIAMYFISPSQVGPPLDSRPSRVPRSLEASISRGYPPAVPETPSLYQQCRTPPHEVWLWEKHSVDHKATSSRISTP
jgi:hypothetical protein